MMIPVEKLARDKLIGVPNAYILILFACCRTVMKQTSDQYADN
jgi:hypothetical protein